MNKLIVKTARHCLGMSLVIFSALAFAGAMKTVESTALGDSDIDQKLIKNGPLLMLYVGDRTVDSARRWVNRAGDGTVDNARRWVDRPGGQQRN